jgi:hypothetical protein
MKQVADDMDEACRPPKADMIIWSHHVIMNTHVKHHSALCAAQIYTALTL